MTCDADATNSSNISECAKDIKEQCMELEPRNYKIMLIMIKIE